MFSLFKNSLTIQLVTVSTIVLCIPIIFGLTYFPTQQKKSTLDGVHKYVENRANSLATSVAFALKNANFDLVTFAFKDALKDHNVRYVAIMDETNSIIVDTAIQTNIDRNNIGKKAGFIIEDNHMLYTVDAKADGQKFGRVVLQYSTEETNEELSSNLRMGGIFNIVILISGVVIILIVMRKISGGIQKKAEAEHKYLETAINKILKEMEAFGKGEPTEILVAEREDTIAELYHSFNELTKRVSSLVAEVNNARDASVEQQEYLNSSITQILEAMEYFAEGNLSVRLDITSDDAIGRLYDGFNRSVENIRKLVIQVNDAINNAASVAAQLSASSMEMSSTANDQSQQAKTIAFAISDMATTISENTKKSIGARDQALDTKNVVMTSSERIKSLERSSLEIGEIITVINDITDQTNLLALNAAIEAARAGEAGRGFSVVADEVRKLSERTQQATKDIQLKIRQIQSETKNAIQTLDQINEKTNTVSAAITKVAEGSEEQAKVSEQIAENIENMSSGAVEMSSSISEIARTTESLSILTHDLQQIIGQFEIDGSGQKGLHTSSGHYLSTSHYA